MAFSPAAHVWSDGGGDPAARLANTCPNPNSTAVVRSSDFGTRARARDVREASLCHLERAVGTENPAQSLPSSNPFPAGIGGL